MTGLALWLAFAEPAFAQSHTFTDTSGRTMVAEIMDATDTSVRVRREDGRVFEIALATLAESDRTFVAAWRTQRDFAFGGLEVTAARVRLDVDRTQTRSSTKKTEDWCYRISIANRSRTDLTGLTLEYRLFFVDDVLKADRDELPLKRKSGRAALATLAAGASAEVKTALVTLQIVQLKPGHRYSGTTKRRVEDSLAGIWVRVARQGEVLHEFASPTTLMKSENW